MTAQILSDNDPGTASDRALSSPILRECFVVDWQLAGAGAPDEPEPDDDRDHWRARRHEFGGPRFIGR